MRKEILILLIFIATSFAGPGFFEDEWKEKSAESFSNYTETSPSNGVSTININVDFSDTIRKVLPTIFNHNSNPWIGTKFLQSEKAIDQLNRLEIADMRLPGGNWSNQWMWDGSLPTDVRDNYAADIKGPPNQNWTMNTDDLIALCDSVNARPQPCVNYSLARYYTSEDRVQKAASYAASWVRDLNIVKKKGAKFWEVGNENYGQWQAGYNVSDLGQITGSEYGKDFTIFADSMHAADSTIKVGAVLIPDEGKYNNWSEGVLPEIGNHADYLVIHDYFTYASDLNTVPLEAVLDSIVRIKGDFDRVQKMVAEHTDKSLDHFPIALTEYNVRAGMKDNAMVSNLFVTMTLGEAIEAGYGLVNIWDIANGYKANEGDHGILSRNNPNVENYTAHPTFFAYYYFQKMFGDIMVKTSHNKNKLYCYSSRFSSGEAGVILVNPTASEKTVTVNMNNFTTSDRMYWYTIKANDPEDWTIEINNSRGPDLGFGPDNFWEILPYSSTAESNFDFTLEPWSSNYILVEGATQTSKFEKNESIKTANLNIKQSRNLLKINFPEHANKGNLEIYTFNGRLAKSVNISGKSNINIDIHNLAKGSYMVKYENSTHKLFSRFIK